MAFSNGVKSTEAVSARRYKGVASVYVRGVNPTKAELEKFFERNIDKEPVYVGETEDPVTHQKYRQIRIEFLLEVDPNVYVKGKAVDVLKNADGTPIELKTRMSIFLTDRPLVGRASGKHQIIDKYGRTAWGTPEEIAARQIPMYSSGPANIDSGYRESYVGEEQLTEFLIAYMNIPSCQDYINGQWVMKDAVKLANCEARLDHIADYFKGDVSELRQILSYQPENKVKVLMGVRTTADGNQYQNVYTRMFLRNNTVNYSRLDKNLQETKNNGGESSTEYDIDVIHEDVVVATDFSKEVPFPAPNNNDPFAVSNTPWGS